MTPTATIGTDAGTLRDICAGPVFEPADDGWDEARQAWNLAIDQRPAAVVRPYDADDVAAVVRHARRAGLRVAPQGTGHGAGPLGDLSRSILLSTSAMKGVEIDPVARRARVGAGVLWGEVTEAAGAHGLAPLSGSSHDVGVVGYSLGGGMSWLARKYGFACNHITAAELVLSDGAIVRADATNHADLFWALRGGGGNVGIVCELEFELFEHATVIGGAMAWDWHLARRVLERWVQWAPTAPDEITTSARILQLPPLPTVPEPLRGRQVVMIDGAYCGDPARADEVLAPLRELQPELDTFGPMPASALVFMHGDPPVPVPAVSATTMVRRLDQDAVDAFVAAAGPGSGSPLVSAELRQMGGALRRPPAGHGAISASDADAAVFCVGMAMDAESGAAAQRHARTVCASLDRWSTGEGLLNFTEDAMAPTTAYRRDALARLQAIRAEYDPDRVLHANHPV